MPFHYIITNRNVLCNRTLRFVTTTLWLYELNRQLHLETIPDDLLGMLRDHITIQPLDAWLSPPWLDNNEVQALVNADIRMYYVP